MKFVFALLLSIFSTMILAEQTANVSLDRAWGLLIGDEINVQIDLPVAAKELDMSSLPQTDMRHGTWLYLKKIKSEDNNLWLTYQVVNVPISNETIFTPELNLRQLSDEWITVPAMPLTIGSLLTADSDNNPKNTATKADHASILINTIVSKQRLTLFTVIAVISFLVLFVWHIGWRPRNRQPFSQAVHELSRLKWSRSKQPAQAARILHEAFNNTAGTIVVYNELEQLVEKVSWMQPLEDQIFVFYQSSANYFFTQNTEREPDFEAIMKLAKACRSKEKLA
jgi:mxaA protein